jgi:hypothetical protein
MVVPRQCIGTSKQLIGLPQELSQRGAAVKCSERPGRACNGTYLRAGCLRPKSECHHNCPFPLRPPISLVRKRPVPFP